MRQALRTAILASLGLVAAGAPALAGGFHVREQSAVFQGSSFAGNAAGGSLSSMFWNSAAVAQHQNLLTTESHFSLILPSAEITPLPGSTLLALGDSGDIGREAVVPASYYAYALGNGVVLGLGVNSPFGLVTEPQNSRWAGQFHSRTSSIKTINFNPVVAWQINPIISIGIGAQAQWIKGKLKSASPFAGNPNLVVEAEDIALGFTAGIMITPTKSTTIGIGYRSAIDHKLEGEVYVSQFGGLGVTGPGVHADAYLPEIVTLSLRQAITPNLTLLGTVEWTNWSRLQKLDIVCDTPGAVPPCVQGATLNSLHLGWHDGWFVSGGLEWQAMHNLMLRGGVAWEKSPIQNADERTSRVPDSDRIWASVGLSYKWSETMIFDLAYSHIFVDSAQIDRTEGGVRLLADVDAHVDIIAASMRMKFGAAEKPLK